MKKTIIFNLIILIAFSLGIFTGSFSTSFFSDNPVYLYATSDLLPTVFTLKRLRENRVSETIELLEMKLDGMLVGLKDYGELSGNRQDRMTTRSIKLAIEYRSNYPPKTNKQEIDNIIEKLLSAVS
jgi:hypothetical protein